MQKIVFGISFLILMSTSAVAEEVPVNDFFQFFTDGQQKLVAPGGEVCDPSEVAGEEKFNAQKCLEQICPKDKKIGIEQSDEDTIFTGIECAVKKEKVSNLSETQESCKKNKFEKYFPQIKEISESLQKFMKSELNLTGKKIRASIDYLKNPENPNSDFDNLSSNVGDLWTFIMNNDDFYSVDKTHKGLEIKLKSTRKLKRKLKQSFRLSTSEEAATIEVIEALFADSSSLIAVAMLGPDYTMKKVLDERKIDMEPIAAMRKIKEDAVSKLKETLGQDSIDPEYKEANKGGILTDKETLVVEALILDSVAKRISPKTLKKMSKPDFTKPSFYNKEKFDRDWTDPFGDRYLNTQQYLENLSSLYQGDEEVRDSDVFLHIGNIISGLELLPEESDLDEVKKKVPQFYDNYFKQMGKEFSASSTRKVKDNIDDIHIKYPRTRKEYLDNISDWLKYKQAVADDTSSQLAEKNNKKATAYFGRLYLQSLLIGESEEGGVAELAPLMAINPLPDFYLGSYNGIKMGPFAVAEFDGSGKQVLGHELGHHVGHFMEDHPLSNQTTLKFEKVRECLASSHKEKSKEIKKKIRSKGKKTYKWKENFYTEEDFSDWISAKASDGNFACFMASGMSTEGTAESLFTNFNKNDPHSSVFYRLLNIELHQKGRLPASCKNDYVKKCPSSKTD